MVAMKSFTASGNCMAQALATLARAIALLRGTLQGRTVHGYVMLCAIAFGE